MATTQKGKPDGSSHVLAALSVTPPLGTTNVKPTTAVTWRGPLFTASPPKEIWSHQLQNAHNPLHFGLIVVSNAQGSTVYSLRSPAVHFDAQTGTLTWTPPAETVHGTTTSVLGRYTEDSVAWLAGPWAARLTKTQQSTLNATGTLTLPGVQLTNLFPEVAGQDGHQGTSSVILGEVAQVHHNTITLFGGHTLTVPSATRVHIPGRAPTTLSALRPGQVVRITPATGKASKDHSDKSSQSAKHASKNDHKKHDSKKHDSVSGMQIDVLNTPRFSDTVFTTGSAIGEPVHWSAAWNTTHPSVLHGATLTVQATDSYGDPATTGSFMLHSTGSGLSSTLQTPSGTLSQGHGTSLVTDHRAQAVGITVATQGPWSQDATTIPVSALTFQPGPAAHMTLTAPATVNAGHSLTASGLVTDVYGNPVLPTTLDFSTGTGTITSSTVTHNGTYQVTYTAPNTLQELTPGTGETVTLTGRSLTRSASVTHTVTVDPGPVAHLAWTQPATLVAGASGTFTATATDAYGNAVLNGTAFTVQSTGGQVPSTVTSSGGTLAIPFTAPSAAGSYTVTVSSGSFSTTLPITVTTPVPASATVHWSSSPSGSSTTLTGTLTTANGTPVSGATLTLEATSGTLSSSTVTTNGNGQFTVTATPSGSAGMSLSTSGAGTKGSVPLGTTAIDPLIYGSQPWTDTGIAVQAGQVVTITATGPWASQLEAELGGSGAVISAGSSVSFVAGTSGILDLGPGSQTVSGTVDALVSLSSPTAVLPTLDLTAASTTVSTSGTDTLHGKLEHGSWPVVDAPVVLNTASGQINQKTAPVTVTTNGQGSFSGTYDAPSGAGSTTVTAGYTPPTGSAIHQTVALTVKASAASISSLGFTHASAAFDSNLATAAVTNNVYGYTPTTFSLTRTFAAPTKIAQIAVAGEVSNWDNALHTSTDGFTVQALINGSWQTIAPYASLVHQVVNGQYVYQRVMTLSTPVSATAIKLVWPGAETSFTVNTVETLATPVSSPFSAADLAAVASFGYNSSGTTTASSMDITNVQFSQASPGPTIVITGSGFGSTPPQTVSAYSFGYDSPNLAIFYNGYQWGYYNSLTSNWYGVDYVSWSSTKIVIGFLKPLSPGAPITVDVIRPHSKATWTGTVKFPTA